MIAEREIRLLRAEARGCGDTVQVALCTLALGECASPLEQADFSVRLPAWLQGMHADEAWDECMVYLESVRRSPT